MTNVLPTRRDEAWKYSDLRAAFADAPEPKMVGEGTVIERLAAGADRSESRIIAPGQGELFVDDFSSDGFVPAADRVHVGAGGWYHRIVIQTGAGIPLSSCRVKLDAGATFKQFVLGEGGKLARVETIVEAGPNANIEINGVYLAGAGRHIDQTSTIVMGGQGGTARQLIKGVARKGGRGVFQGKIVVERAAQKADARQYHHGMLLEDGAEIYAKPELMIHADDVQCAHGNTAGGLDESKLFYLRSRGIPEAEARALMIEAFLLEALPDWAPPDVTEEITGRIQTWLRGGQ